jgi:hypothetical protein
MSEGMEAFLQYKVDGNKSYKMGQFVEACLSYAKAVEGIREYESTGLNSDRSEPTEELKASLFLNLGMANFNMGEFDACRRCCNTALVLCQKPSMLLDDLGVEDDLDRDLPVDATVMPIFLKKTAAKALYRRGLCLVKCKSIIAALEDFKTSLLLLPGDTRTQQAIAQHSIQISTQSLHEADVSSMTVNGGTCLLRRAFWSQTPSEVYIHIPFESLSTTLGIECSRILAKEICIESDSISITHVSTSCVVVESLAHKIIPNECIWTLNDGSFLILYIIKNDAPEKFPGCEWWDRVFVGDEKIETLTCSVGNTRDLPVHAVANSHRQHARFLSLSKEEQQKELDFLAASKQVFRLII